MIYIPKELPYKYVATFAFIQYLIPRKGDTLTTQQILHYMNYENNQYNRKWMNSHISYMIDNEIISGTLVKQNRYKFNRNSITFDPGSFYSCDIKDFQRIMELNIEESRNNLAGYYGILSSTFNYKTKVGSPYLSELCDKTGLNKATVLKYNKILEDNKLIYIVHSTIKGKPNYYSKNMLTRSSECDIF